MPGAAAAPTLSAPAAWAIAALWLATAGLARAETADERDLRDHAAGNNLPAVQTLLAGGASPNVPDHDGRTAVHHAANIAKAAILEALLEAGGDPDVQDAAGSTPLHLAADFPYFEPDSQFSVRVLLAAGADPGVADRDGRTPLHLVARNHEEAVSVRDLLARGADANATDHRGDTPLHHAVGRGSPFSAEVVEALVSGGASGDIAGGSGETPLQLFVRVGSDNSRIVHALVAGGADPDGRNPDGETPLHTAIRSGGSAESPEVVEALLGAGADPCLQDATGYIPYHTAREGGTVHDLLARAGGSDLGCGRDDRKTAEEHLPADDEGESAACQRLHASEGCGYRDQWEEANSLRCPGETFDRLVREHEACWVTFCRTAQVTCEPGIGLWHADRCAAMGEEAAADRIRREFMAAVEQCG